MAYIPSAISITPWSSPITIQGTDRIADLNSAVNSIISTHANSLKNFVNVEIAKIPTYLTTEMALVYTETNNSAISASASAVTATAQALSASNSATSAALSLANTNGLINTGFPSQTANAGKYLTTNGTAVQWTSIPIDEQVSHLSVTAVTYNADGTLATMTYTGGYKTLYNYTVGILSTVQYTDTNGTTVLLTETFGYTSGNLTSVTRS